MTYKQNLIEFINEIVTSLYFTVKIKSYSFDEDTQLHTLEVCDIFYLTGGGTASKPFLLLIGGFNYEIVSVDDETKVIVLKDHKPILDSNPIGVDSFILPSIYFFHGTISETSNELNKITDLTDKTPMVFMLETFKERFYEDEAISTERRSDFTLFFLTQADFQNWKTENFYDNAILPMKKLCEQFINKLKNHPKIKDDFEWEAINHSRFGVYINNKGYENNLFAENLSGVQLNLQLKINRPTHCEDEC